MKTLRTSAGFSLLEMIGVMAVMAILAGALAPSIFQMIEEAGCSHDENLYPRLRCLLSDLKAYISRWVLLQS